MRRRKKEGAARAGGRRSKDPTTTARGGSSTSPPSRQGARPTPACGQAAIFSRRGGRDEDGRPADSDSGEGEEALAVSCGAAARLRRFPDAERHDRQPASYTDRQKRPVAIPGIKRLNRDGTPARDANGKPVYDPIIEFANRAAADRFSAMVLELVRRDHPNALAGTDDLFGAP